MTIGAGSPNNPGRFSDAVEHLAADHPVDSEPPAKRRRVFLQTMGQQLRGVGMSNKDAPCDDHESSSQACAVDAVFASDRASSRQVNVQIQTPESDAVPGEDDQNSTGGPTGGSKQLWHPEEIAAPRSDPGAITFDNLLSWTQSYFDNWHLVYPFLHAPTVLKHFKRVAHVGMPDPALPLSNELVILRSIMSIALADRRQTGTIMPAVPTNLVFSSFNESIHSVRQALSEESSIESLQAIISVQLFLISMLRYNAASRLQGLAARMAFQLGLHRCPMRYSGFPRNEAQLRKRMFWSIYCIDRYICIRLCVPQTIRDSDVDVCWPTSEQHGEHIAEKGEYDDRLDLLIFLSRHAEVRGLIMELRNRSDSQSQVDTDEAVTINAELSKWWNDVETYLESSTINSVPLSKYHEVTLVVLRHEAIIAINKHTIATARKPSTYSAALQNCIGASRAILTALYRVLESSGRLNPSSTHEDSEDTALLWPSFTWAVWMSAFIMIYAANEDQVPVDVATRLADRSLVIFKHLALRGSAWPNACAAAIVDMRGQLVERRNQLKNANAAALDNGVAVRVDTKRPLRGSMPIEEKRPESVPSTPNTAITQWASQPNDRPNHISHYPGPQMRADSISIRDIPNPPEYTSRTPVPASTIVSTPGSVSRADTSSSSQHPPQQVSQPLPVKPSLASFTDLPPNPNSYVNMGMVPLSGMGQQFVAGIPMPSDEGMEMLYGLDMPFWINNSQWRGV